MMMDDIRVSEVDFWPSHHFNDIITYDLNSDFFIFYERQMTKIEYHREKSDTLQIREIPCAKVFLYFSFIHN